LASVQAVVTTDQAQSTSDLDPRTQWAPDVAALVARLLTDVWGATDPDALALVRVRIAQLLRNEAELERQPIGAPELSSARLAAAAQWPTSPLLSERERTCLEFTEQFVMDVAGVSDELRASIAAALGPAALGAFVTALYLLDYGQRTQMAVERLFPDVTVTWLAGGEGIGGDAEKTGVSLQDDLDELMKATARLDSIDMVTTEMVRLRGARRHNCRICQSTRSVKALDAGADEAMFDKIDRYEGSDLADPHKIALRLTDAMITQPGEIDPSLVAQVHGAFTPAQIIEIVADVMRNSAQKVAVALAVDGPHVTSGVELYAITEEGDVEYLS
jgi:alkylhydroperoxidase family enzyme